MKSFTPKELLHHNTSYTYDDVYTVPKYSEIFHRGGISLETRLSRNYKLRTPIVASPMDTVCEYQMAAKLGELGGIGFIHRFISIEKQAAMVDMLNENYTAGAAIGVTGDYMDRAKALIKAGVNVLLLDVAHGDHLLTKSALSELKSYIKSQDLSYPVDIIAGNVATADAVRHLVDWGADGIRCGIGGGSMCSTRVQTSCGVPNITAILDCCYNDAFYNDIPIMADGGIRTSGDMVKALACGASTIMLGSLLAGTTETPGEIIKDGSKMMKSYRGSASYESKLLRGEKPSNIEGAATVVPYKGDLEPLYQSWIDGIKSGLSYSGVGNLEQFRNRAEFVVVTNAGHREAQPHLLFGGN